MRLVHEADGETRTLATDVEFATSFVQKFMGLRFRSSIPEAYGLVFTFDSVRKRRLDMVFVRTPIDVVWRDGDEVVGVKTLSAWTGTAAVASDSFIELAPGVAEGIEVGDTVRLEDS